MWKAKIIDKDVYNQNGRIIVEFSNDEGQIYSREFYGTGSIKQFCIDELARIQKVYTFIDETSLGFVDLTPIVEVPVEQTPEEKAKQEYAKGREEVITLKEDLDCGLISQAEFDAKVAEVKNKKQTQAK